MRCPAKNQTEGPPCRGCLLALDDAVFKQKILGGKIELVGEWCSEVIDIGKYINRLREKLDEKARV